MVQVVVLDVSLIPQLRPATRIRVRDLLAPELFPLDRATAPEDIDAGVIRVRQDDRVTRITVDDPGESGQVRAVSDRQPVTRDRRVELQRFEEARGRARENGDPVRGRADLLGEPSLDRLSVFFDALPFR